MNLRLAFYFPPFSKCHGSYFAKGSIKKKRKQSMLHCLYKLRWQKHCSVLICSVSTPSTMCNKLYNMFIIVHKNSIQGRKTVLHKFRCAELSYFSRLFCYNRSTTPPLRHQCHITSQCPIHVCNRQRVIVFTGCQRAFSCQCACQLLI